MGGCIGLAKKFVQVFTYDVTEKNQMYFLANRLCWSCDLANEFLMDAARAGA